MAKQLNISKTYVFNAVKKHKETGKFVDDKCSRRPRELRKRDQRHLKQFFKGETMLSVSKITKDLRPPPPPKKSIFVKKMKIEINAWEDSPSSALSETL